MDSIPTFFDIMQYGAMADEAKLKNINKLAHTVYKLEKNFKNKKGPMR
jgi:hypothetical protein